LVLQTMSCAPDKAAVANRLQKVLEDANIKLAGVATDVLGVSGRAMIARLIRGVDDPETLAAEARGRLKTKAIPLRRALSGRVTAHHRFQLELHMDQVRQLEGLIARLEGRIAEVMGPLAEAAARLTTIPGVGQRAAEVIVAEIGVDMAQYPTAGHLASWAGFCPGNNESAGKRRTGRTTKGSVWLRATLVQVAWSASHTKTTILAARYRSLAKRLGKKKALVALGHKILRIIDKMLSHRTDYVERFDPGLAA
jgi:transposase